MGHLVSFRFRYATAVLSLLIVARVLAQEAQQHASDPMPWWVGLAIGTSAWFVIAYLFFTGKLHGDAEVKEWKQLWHEEREARRLSDEAARDAVVASRLVAEAMDALQRAARGT